MEAHDRIACPSGRPVLALQHMRPDYRDNTPRTITWGSKGKTHEIEFARCLAVLCPTLVGGTGHKTPRMEKGQTSQALLQDQQEGQY